MEEVWLKILSTGPNKQLSAHGMSRERVMSVRVFQCSNIAVSQIGFEILQHFTNTVSENPIWAMIQITYVQIRPSALLLKGEQKLRPCLLLVLNGMTLLWKLDLLVL